MEIWIVKDSRKMGSQWLGGKKIPYLYEQKNDSLNDLEQVGLVMN